MKKTLAFLLVLALLAGWNATLLAKDGEDDDPSPSPTVTTTASASPSGTASPSSSASPSASAMPDATMQALEDRIETGHEDWSGRYGLLRELAALRVLRGDTTTPVVVNGIVLRFDVPPLLCDNRLMVPVRAVTTAFGAEVDWRPLLPDIVTIAKTVTNADGTMRLVRIVINLRTGIVTKDGTMTVLDVKPALVSGRTLVPLRFIAEAFGKYVDYDKVSKGVFIDDRFPPGVVPPVESTGATPSASPSPSGSPVSSPGASPSASPSPSP